MKKGKEKQSKRTGSGVHRNLPQRSPNLIFAALWMIVANAVFITVWRFGFIPLSPPIFYSVASVLGGIAVGVALFATRRFPKRRE